ncbi:hypothetical protein DL98DRAFT_647882 [Cadophora sp. DSE1049]|nr:hypothetical protein DL98DRAFT_647882 [Cadophora sp. DSE1049]
MTAMLAKDMESLTLLPRYTSNPVPIGTDFTARFTAWQQGPKDLCPTSDRLASLARPHLEKFYQEAANAGSSGRSSPWTLTPLPGGSGPLPRPIEMDISCQTSVALESEAVDDNDRRERAQFLTKTIMVLIRRMIFHPDSQKLFNRCLVGYSVSYPAVPTFNDEIYKLLEFHPFHLPEIEEWSKREQEIIRTEFYHGPLLLLKRTADFLSAYGPLIQNIPVGYFEESYLNEGIAGLQYASVALPRLQYNILDLSHLDRTRVDGLIKGCYPSVLRCMEDVLEALEELAMATKSSNPSIPMSCNAIYKIYKLKRTTPSLTAALVYLADKKAQEKFVWGTIALGSAFVVTAALLFPVAAPFVSAASSTSTATVTSGSIVTAAASGNAVTSTAAVRSGVVGARTFVRSSLKVLTASSSVVGGGMTVSAAVKHAESNNMICINDVINATVETITYYLALCFMKANAVNPHEDKESLEYIVNEQLYGRLPKLSEQKFRAAYLHRHLRKLAADFRDITDGLRNLGFPIWGP